MKDEKRVRTKNERSGISEICTVCGEKMFKRAKATDKTKVPSEQRSKKVGKVKVKAKSKRK